MTKSLRFLALCVILVNLSCFYSYLLTQEGLYENADEGHYLRSAQLLADKGINHYPQIFETYTKPSFSIKPNPLRIGYYLVASLMIRVGGANYISIAHVSFLSFLLLLFLSFWFLRKFLNRDFAWLYLLLFAFSPLSLALAKRGLSDMPANLFLASSLGLFYGYLVQPKKGILLLITALVSSLMILMREQAVLTLLFFLITAFIWKWRFRQEVSILRVLGMLLISGIITVTVWLWAAGGVELLLQTFKTMWGAPSRNAYSVLYTRGVWFRYIVDYFLISPVTTILGLSFVAYLLARRELLKNELVTYFLLYFIIQFFLISGLDYNLNVRYALSLDLVLRGFAIFMLMEIFRKKERQIQYVYLALLCLCLIEYHSFYILFCQGQVYDPISSNLLRVRRLIP